MLTTGLFNLVYQAANRLHRDVAVDDGALHRVLELREGYPSLGALVRARAGHGCLARGLPVYVCPGLPLCVERGMEANLRSSLRQSLTRCRPSTEDVPCAVEAGRPARRRGDAVGFAAGHTTVLAGRARTRSRCALRAAMASARPLAHVGLADPHRRAVSRADPRARRSSRASRGVIPQEPPPRRASLARSGRLREGAPARELSDSRGEGFTGTSAGALTSLRRIPAMKRTPVTASRRPRSAGDLLGLAAAAAPARLGSRSRGRRRGPPP